MAFRVPIGCLGQVDLTCELSKEATHEREICAAMKAARMMKAFLGYTNEKVVATDWVASCTSVFDAEAGMARWHFRQNCLVVMTTSGAIPVASWRWSVMTR